MENIKVEKSIDKNILGITYENNLGQKTFISSTIIQYLVELKKTDKYFVETISALVDLKYKQ